MSKSEKNELENDEVADSSEGSAVYVGDLPGVEVVTRRGKTAEEVTSAIGMANPNVVDSPPPFPTAEETEAAKVRLLQFLDELKEKKENPTIKELQNAFTDFFNNGGKLKSVKSILDDEQTKRAIDEILYRQDGYAHSNDGTTLVWHTWPDKNSTRIINGKLEPQKLTSQEIRQLQNEGKIVVGYGGELWGIHQNKTEDCFVFDNKDQVLYEKHDPSQYGRTGDSDKQDSTVMEGTFEKLKQGSYEKLVGITGSGRELTLKGNDLNMNFTENGSNAFAEECTKRVLCCSDWTGDNWKSDFPESKVNIQEIKIKQEQANNTHESRNLLDKW